MRRRKPEVLSRIIYYDREIVEVKELVAYPDWEYEDDTNNAVTDNASETSYFPSTSGPIFSASPKRAPPKPASPKRAPPKPASPKRAPPRPAVKKSEKDILLTLIQQLEMRKCIPSSNLESLKEECQKIKDFDSIFVLLKDTVRALNDSVESSITTRNRTNPTKEFANSLLDKNKDLQDKLNGLLMNMKSYHVEFCRKEAEIRKFRSMEASRKDEQLRNARNLETLVGVLRKENEKLKEEIGIGIESYKNLRELLDKKNSEIKHLLFLYREVIKEKNIIKAGCEACIKFKEEAERLQRDCKISDRMLASLKYRSADLEKKEEWARKEIKALQKQVKELKFKLYTETIQWPQKRADRWAISAYYFKGKVPRLNFENKDPDPNGKRPMEEPCETQCNHAYDEPSTSNSMPKCARCGFHDHSFHNESAEDNLNTANFAEEKEKNDSSSDCESFNSHLFPAKKLKK